MRLLLFLIFAGVATQSSAQENPLNFYGDVMINATVSEHRSFAATQYHSLLKKRLNKANSFNDEFIDIAWMSKLYPADSSFRIMTYQVQTDLNQFESFGLIQKENGAVINLKNVNKELDDDVVYMSLDKDNWFGALYYNIHETQIDGQTKYILFGYDGYSEYDKRKVADVLSFQEDGSISFGEEIFVKKIEGQRDEVMQRLVIKYSADSNVTLNYHPGLDLIVHDHLIPRIGTMPGQGATHLSDGSLVGYKFEEGTWNYVPKIYNEVSDEAPRPQPVFNDGSGKNIMGEKAKEKKKKRRK